MCKGETYTKGKDYLFTRYYRDKKNYPNNWTCKYNVDNGNEGLVNLDIQFFETEDKRDYLEVGYFLYTFYNLLSCLLCFDFNYNSFTSSLSTRDGAK